MLCACLSSLVCPPRQFTLLSSSLLPFSLSFNSCHLYYPVIASFISSYLLSYPLSFLFSFFLLFLFPSSYSLSLFPILFFHPLFISPLNFLHHSDFLPSTPRIFSPTNFLPYSLQASGRISRKLAELEEYTCDILATLSTSLFRDVALDKMMSAIKALPAAELKTSPLSNVGAAYACVVLQNNPSAASELKSFFASSASHHASQTGRRTTQCCAVQCDAILLSL
jgi:hypothetical protein